jgi:1,4-dihydroxy-2-naphthoate octaprenyltransferase
LPSVRKLFLVTGPWSFAMSAVSVTAGTLIATGFQVNVPLYALSLLMVVPIHASANLLNDCYDVMTGADKPGAMVLKPHPILSGTLSLKATIAYAAALMTVGLFAGAVLSALGRPYSLLIVATAVFLMLCYNVPPLRLKERGLGEELVFLVWGPLMFLGCFYLQSDTIAVVPVMYSVPLGLLVASVLLVDDIRDMTEDAAIGRVTVATMLGKSRALQLYSLTVAVSYLAVGAVAFYFARPWLLLVLISVPAFIILSRQFEAELPQVAPDRVAAQLMIIFGLLYAVGAII